MRIIVVGDGKVGHELAKHLVKERHDVTIVDNRAGVLEKTADLLDVLCIDGNGANIQTLQQADARHTDILIATTASDETNMLCCLLGKRMGAQYTIARIRDPEYMSSSALLQKELAIDYIINPERATAREISRMLRYPYAGNVETFARGRVEMMDFRALAGDPMVGIPLRELYSRHPRLSQVLFCAVERDHEAIIPKGDFVVREGDRVFVAGDVQTITAFFKQLRENVAHVRRVMIMGGSRIGYYLAKTIVPMGMQVSLVEINRKKAERLSEMLPEVTVIEGDGSEQELLESEGLSDMDAFVTLCDRDEENLMAGLYAARRGVGKVIVKNNRDNYAALMSAMGLESMVSPKTVTCNTILRTVRARGNRSGSAVTRMYRLMDGRAEALEFSAVRGAPYIGVPLKNLHVRDNTLVAVIVRGGQVVVPFGNDHIEPEDSIIIVTKEQGLDDLGDILMRR